MAIAQNIVDAQAFGYSRCAVASTMCAIEAEIYGEKGCGGDSCRAMFYWWGVDVLSRTLTQGCDCTDKCVTDEFACSVIRLLNPGCIECGCGSADDIPTNCDITPDRTVYQAVDAANQNTIPHVAGRQTLIVSDTTGAANDWASHVGDVATDDGAGNYTYWTPTAGLVIHSGANNTDYLTYAGGAGPMFPVVNGSLAGVTLTLTTTEPPIASAYNRSVLIEVSADGVTWTPVYVGAENTLVSGAAVTISGSPSLVRTTYYYGEDDDCSASPVLGVIASGAASRSFEFSPTNPGGCLSLYNWELNGGVAVAPLLSDMTAFTFAMWMKFTGTQDPGGEIVQICLFAETPDKIPLDIFIYFSTGFGSLIYSVHPGWTSAIPPANVDVLADGNWHHFAYTYELGAPQKIYIDGVLADTMSNGLALEAGALAGNRIPNVYMANNLTMRYCEVYLCQSARSQADIANIIMAQDIIGNDAGWGRYFYMRPNDTDTGGQSTIDPNNPLIPMWSYRNLAITDPTFANDRP